MANKLMKGGSCSSNLVNNAVIANTNLLNGGKLKTKRNLKKIKSNKKTKKTKKPISSNSKTKKVRLNKKNKKVYLSKNKLN